MHKFVSGFLVFTLGIFIAQWTWRLLLAHRSKRWPQTQARILAARIVGGKDRKGNEELRPEVRYEYSVAGRSYVGALFSFDSGTFISYATAIDAMDGIVAGSQVPIYYDPLRPQQSVLFPGRERARFFQSSISFGDSDD